MTSPGSNSMWLPGAAAACFRTSRRYSASIRSAGSSTTRAIGRAIAIACHTPRITCSCARVEQRGVVSARDANRRRLPMLFMVIERFKDRDPIPVYKRVRDQGIKFPEGLTYVGSWIEPNFDRCFQLMECDDARLLQEWILNCQGLGMTFEIVPVVPSKETREVVAPFLDSK